MIEIRCCGHEECTSCVIDISTPDTLHRDFHNWLHGNPKDQDSSKPATDGRKNRRKGTNLYGRPYCPGRPLSMEERTRIIELHSTGMKVNAISKSLCISHGCVSKIISRFRATGVLLPATSPEQRKTRKRKTDQSTNDISMIRTDQNCNEFQDSATFILPPQSIPSYEYKIYPKTFITLN